MEATTPKFPYDLGHVLGQPSANRYVHSGCHGGVHEKNVKTWQQQMRKRGWTLKADGCFGPQTEKVCHQFQAEKHLPITGTVGPVTWYASWAIAPAEDKTWRDKVAAWHQAHLGITESPPGSNCDSRVDGIRHAQDGCAGGTWLRHQPWCGVWAWAGLHSAGLVKKGTGWMASVSAIEDHARKAQGPFRAWTFDGSHVSKGDLVVLFGRGIHIGTVRDIDAHLVYTWEGNTSADSSGSQSNGGGAFRRTRTRRGQVFGYALVKGD